MANFRSFSEIVSTMIQRLNLTQPNLDTKTGTVSRDLFIDLPADQIARLYNALSLISDKQSLATTNGSDLDRLASNFGTSRSVGTAASGTVIVCTNTLVTDISIPTGTNFTARNGFVYRSIGNYVLSSYDRNRLAANANRIRKQLNLAGINATYALEIPVQSSRIGTAGNIGSLQIVNADLRFPVNVTNISAMTGGANRESDESFRSRILSIFSGANIGTSSGYRNSILGLSGVLDVLVVEPGNSLMLRDGTETVVTNDGTTRILNSGTGGKVDIYVLGRKIQENSESFIFTNLSSSGNISDERNDHILGQANQDITRTIEERRILAFTTGNIPAQPVDSINSVVGSLSGVLTQKYTDNYGKIQGNYELLKDYNPESGGSPFGYDKIHFISGYKDVNADSVTKSNAYSIDALPFTEINKIKQIYSEVSEIDENSTISTAGSKYIQLMHTPVVKVSKVQNKTTGEIYSVVSQSLNNDGINETGLIEISGKTLPTPSDILGVNYTWRQIYDEYIDYASDSLSQFKDENSVDSIDWTPTGGIFEESSTVVKSNDGINYIINLEYPVNKISSVYTKTKLEATISVISVVNGKNIVGIIIPNTNDAIDNILSIKRISDGLEGYNTKANDGTFMTRTIYLPSDTPFAIGDSVMIEYNKIELYNFDITDGSYYNNIVVLPSESILDSQDVLSVVDDLYLTGDSVYVKYVANLVNIFPSSNLSSLPITGTTTSNSLLSNNIATTSSVQPIVWEYSAGLPSKIVRFGPTHMKVTASSVSNPGKIKISGTSLNRYVLDVVAGNVKSGYLFNINSDLKKALNLSSLPANIGIAKIDNVSKLAIDGTVESEFDILGYALNNTQYDIGSVSLDANLFNYQFTLPQTINNNSIEISSADMIRITLLVYNTNAYEELYFANSSSKVTQNLFGRISSISVSSGFRGPTGTIVGSITIDSYNQPAAGQTYFVDYNFIAPKEGERITVSYNINQVIIDATNQIEAVRPVTADVLIKEAEEILVDVSGTLLINDDALAETDKIIENVINSVSNLLNTSKLGTTVDYSDIISVAAAENGVDSVNISLFNKQGSVGRKAFIKALDNQSISAGTIIFEAVSRNKFRIN